MTYPFLSKEERVTNRRYRSDDMSNVVIMSSPTQVAAYASNGYNLIRFNDTPGVFKQDFKSVEFGDRQWEDHVAIDPDRTYGIDLRYIHVYELMKFGAYAQDGLNSLGTH